MDTKIIYVYNPSNLYLFRCRKRRIHSPLEKVLEEELEILMAFKRNAKKEEKERIMNEMVKDVRLRRKISVRKRKNSS